MQKRIFLVIAAMGLAITTIQAQSYNVVIKGGHVMDPKNNIDAEMDIAVKDGKIALVAQNINPKLGLQVVDATGMYVTPGLIDIHTHNFYGTEPDHQYENGNLALPPDGFTFRNGVTTAGAGLHQYRGRRHACRL